MKLVFAGLTLAALAAAHPSAAQVTGALSVQNDYEFRGYSLSARKPAAVLDLSLDTVSGVYLNGSAIADLDIDSRPQIMGAIANIGYARRVAPGVSLDGGLTDLELFQQYGAPADLRYLETYVGVLANGFSGRLNYSPNYFHAGTSSLYSELGWGAATVAKIHVNVHLGVLSYVHLPYGYSRRGQYDWRLGASRPFGPLDLELALTGGGPGPDFYDLHPHPKTALTAGVSWTF